MEEECGPGGGASFPESFRRGAKDFVFLRKVVGDVCNDARLELVYDRGEGYRSVVVQDCGVGLFVDEDGLAVHLGLKGVALLGHTLEEEGES